MDRIEHSGVVERVDSGRVFVEITAKSACGGCSARAACGMSEATRKVVEVHTPEAARYAPGDQVTVAVTRHMGATAVVLAYVVPFVVLIFVVVAALSLGLSEGWAALAGLVSVILYYGALWLGRHRIEEKIHFTISK